ncbi:Membrane protein of ER body 1, partial [Cucurbita argyrosperma subsp. sororia]
MSKREKDVNESHIGCLDFLNYLFLAKRSQPGVSMETKEVNKSWEEQFSLRMAGKMKPDFLKKKPTVDFISTISLRKPVEAKEIEEINYWENIAERKYTEAEPILQILSSIETWLTCLDGFIEIKKLKMERTMLFRLNPEKFSSYGHYKTTFMGGRLSLSDLSTNYFWLLQGGIERSCIDLMERLLRLTKQLTEQEDDARVDTRRELEHAEKVYLISRRRNPRSQSSSEVDDVISKHSDEKFLTDMIRRKKEMIKLEAIFVGLLHDRERYLVKELSGYSKDVLGRAVSLTRELLALDELSDSELIEQMDFGSLDDVTWMLMSWRKDYSWRQREIYPNLCLGVYINAEYKIYTLERMVNLREQYLRLEDEYLWVLEERHTKKHANTYTSFDVHQIHLEYIWEKVLQTSLNWRNDWILRLDAYTRELQKSFEHDVLDNEIMEELKEAERAYCDFIERRHITNLDNIPLMDVSQIYAKYNHPKLLVDINSLRLKMKKLESDCDRMLLKVTYEYKQQERVEYERMAKARKLLWKIDYRYFDRFKHMESKKFLQLLPSTSKVQSFQASESFNFFKMLNDSIKSYNIYCSKCQNCINNLIQSDLKLEDVEESSAKFSYEDEKDIPKKCYEVLYKFLNLHTIHCPACTNYVREVTIQHAPKQSTTLVQVPKPSIHGTDEKIIDHQEGLVITIFHPDEPRTRVRRWEIRRLIVLGGLMESITSLAIVTAAMSAKISDGNIIALALTNLIAGLFIIRHDVSRLQKRKIPGIEVDGNNYKEVLKEKMYSLLCFIIAYLSFLCFGLVPPLVYALSSLKIRNKNLKIIAAAGASLSCTALLAVQKAHINQKPRHRLVYVKTAAVDVSAGVGAFGISYLAGYMFGHLAEELLWDL